MTGGLITTFLVTVRIASTNWGNVVQKRLLAPGGDSPLGLFAGVWGWMTLLTAPWWIGALAEACGIPVGTSTGGHAFWFWMLVTCLLEVPGNVLLLRSLQHTELSIFGPLSSFKPVISLALAMLLFGEVPSLFGAVGVAIVVLGTIGLTSQRRSQADAVDACKRRAGVRDRLLAVLLTATASVFLKQAMDGHTEVQVLSVWCLVSWLLAALWLAGVALISRGRRLPSALAGASRREPQHRAVFIVAVAMLAMQACTIALFARMPVGYALALFQIGSLVSVIIGHRLFGEAQLVRRLVAASIMVAGACVIIIAG